MPTATALDGRAQFHTGIVSDDPAGLMVELTAALGHVWGERIGGTVAVELADGATTVELHAWYSLTEPRIEVVQSIPGTVWVPAVGSGIHHLGYWVDDVAGSATTLEARGYVREAVGLRGGAPYWTYHRHPDGPRVELVGRAMEATMAGYFATGSVRS